MSYVHSEYKQSAKLVIQDSIRVRDDGYPVLIGTVCNDCRFSMFPPREFCSDCLSENVSSIDLSREGTIQAYTVAHSGQAGFETPYAFGFIHLPENIRLYSLLNDRKYNPSGAKSSYSSVNIGDSAELILDKIKTDPKSKEPLFGHKFRPTGGKDD